MTYEKKYKIACKLIENGYIIHCTNNVFSQFDENHISGWPRAHEGYGFYFSDMPYKSIEYGNNWKIVKKQLFNFLKSNTKITNEMFHNNFEKSLNKLYDNLYYVRNNNDYDNIQQEIEQIKEKYESIGGSDLFNAIDRTIKQYDISTIGQLECYIENPKKYIPLLTKLYISWGYDGYETDGIYTIFNIKKLNNYVENFNPESYTFTESIINRNIKHSLKKHAINEGLYDDFNINDADVICYNVNFEPYDDNDEEDDGGYIYIDLIVYDRDGNCVYECENEDYEYLIPIFGENIMKAILNRNGYFDRNNQMYRLDVCDFLTFKNEFEAAKKLFRKQLCNYYPNLHGYIMTDGECIDLGYDDHNIICTIPNISDKFEFIALGNIRCGNSSFDLIQPPTSEQKIALRKLIANSTDLSVDIFNENDKVPVTSVVYHGKINPSIVLGQIDRYFREGINLNSNIRYDDDYIYESLDISSFKLNNELHPKFWKNDKLDSRIRLKLLDIADDFTDYLNVDWVKPEDIIMTGSLSNYNWSDEHSDIDLHIIIDYKKVDKRIDFVREYFNSKKQLWNKEHEDIRILGFPVELYVQDKNESHSSTGIYSIEQNKWIQKPNKQKLNNKNLSSAEKDAEIWANKIDDIMDRYYPDSIESEKEKILKDLDKTINDIKKKRKDGLSGNKNEMNKDNLTFKILRRNGYLDKIHNKKNEIYDNLMSINEGISNNNKLYHQTKSDFNIIKSIIKNGLIPQDRNGEGAGIWFSDEPFYDSKTTMFSIPNSEETLRKYNFNPYFDGNIKIARKTIPFDNLTVENIPFAVANEHTYLYSSSKDFFLSMAKRKGYDSIAEYISENKNFKNIVIYEDLFNNFVEEGTSQIFHKYPHIKTVRLI